MTRDYANEISKTLREYVKFYNDFLLFEQNKFEAVEQNKLNLLDDLVKQEEAFVLKSRGMEQNRMQSQADAGFADSKLRDLIDEAPEDMKEELQTMFKQLNEIVNNIQHVNERCNIAIKARLSAIDRAMEKIKSEEEQKTYDDSASSHKNGKTFFSDKV